jgi:hypothetical protein
MQTDRTILAVRPNRLKVLVCGGRDYDQKLIVWRALAHLHITRGIDVLVHGAASGADTLAGHWAKERLITVEEYPIEVGEGGFRRNARMLASSRPDLVVFFPGGNGTRHMRQIAMEAGHTPMPGLQLAREESQPILF